MSDMDGGAAEAGGCIKALPKGTVRLIGSAQVITSVVSVVKELVENSLDAGSTSVEIKLENFGFDKIEVRDNGEGIKPSDTPFMGRPHYTSKLSQIDDLSSLQTYGFRGEALGSLCAVSRVSITTKTQADLVGMVYDLDHEGNISSSKPSHLGQGTTVSAVQLFHSVPVRKQYYSVAKRRKEELKKVEDLIMAFGLIRHDVRFALRHNREVVWQKSSVPSSRQVLIQIFGSSLISHLEHRQKDMDPDNQKMKVEIYVPKKEGDVQKTSRATNDRSFIFVNGRPVLQKDILKLVKQMYSQATGCESGRFPICFISLLIPPHEIDVNLEPNKTKILLQESSEVLHILKDLMSDIYPCKEPVQIGHPLEESRDERNAHSETNGSLNDSSFSGETSSTFDIDSVPAISARKCNNPVPEPRTVIIPQRNITSSESVPATDPTLPTPSSQVSNLVDSSFLNKEPLLNSTRCDGQNPIINSQNITFDLNFDKEGDDLFRDLDIENAVSSGKTEIDEAPVESVLGTVTPNLPTVPMCGLTRNCVVDKPGETSERNISLQGKANSTTSNDTLLTNCVITENQPASDTASSWSKGGSVKDAEGNKVMPVQLLLPGAPPPRDDLSESRSSSNASMNISTASNSSKSISAASKPGQMTLADVAAMDMIKQATSGFIEFSKSKRPTIIKDNPHADLREVGKKIAAEWNKLSEDEKDLYENMRGNESLRSSTHRETLFSEAGPSTKKRKITNGISSTSVLEMLKSPKPTPARKKSHRPQRETVEVQFSMSELRGKYSDGPIGSQCYKPKPRSLELISEVKPAGWWVALQGNLISAVVPWRIQECLIFHRLMESHTLPTETIENPIPISQSNIDDRLLQTLLSLKMSKPGPSDIYTYCIDPRVEKNGFIIRKGLGPEPRSEIVSMTKCMPLFGLSDLREILTCLCQHSTSTLSQTRPKKVMHYLQGEAVRMMRQMPARVNREDMQDFLSQYYKTLSKTTTKCFHEKPFIHTLHNLENDSSK